MLHSVSSIEPPDSTMSPELFRKLSMATPVDPNAFEEALQVCMEIVDGPIDEKKQLISEKEFLLNSGWQDSFLEKREEIPSDHSAGQFSKNNSTIVYSIDRKYASCVVVGKSKIGYAGLLNKISSRFGQNIYHKKNVFGEYMYSDEKTIRFEEVGENSGNVAILVAKRIGNSTQ